MCFHSSQNHILLQMLKSYRTKDEGFNIKLQIIHIFWMSKFEYADYYCIIKFILIFNRYDFNENAIMISNHVEYLVDIFYENIP